MTNANVLETPCQELPLVAQTRAALTTRRLTPSQTPDIPELLIGAVMEIELACAENIQQRGLLDGRGAEERTNIDYAYAHLVVD